MDLNYILKYIDLIDELKAFHLKPSEYSFFSSAHGILSRVNCKLGHKTSVNNFKKNETIATFFCVNNDLKLENSHMKNKAGKKHKNVEIKQHLLNKWWVID